MVHRGPVPGPVAMSHRILIIDDDLRLGEMLSSYLQTRGYSVIHHATVSAGLDALRRQDFDALVLDVMLPDGDGLQVCRNVRASSKIPILMLTARGDELDRIIGLEMGADDYLPKPFNPRELSARLGAILRRAQPDTTGENVLRFGSITIDAGAREVRIKGERRELTGRQFDLLLFLAERSGRVQSRERLMEALKGETWESFDRSIDVHISRVRNAIEDNPKKPRIVQTVRGTGYVFTPPSAQ